MPRSTMLNFERDNDTYCVETVTLIVKPSFQVKTIVGFIIVACETEERLYKELAKIKRDGTGVISVTLMGRKGEKKRIPINMPSKAP